MRPEKIAIHEAGHAVAHVVLGVDFDYATIEPDGDSAGRVAYTRPHYIVESWNDGERDDPRLRIHIENELIITLCGPAAQRIKFPRSHHNNTITLSNGEKVLARGTDHSQVTRTIFDLFGPNDQVRWKYERYIAARAHALVEANWNDIEAVANALLKDRRLSEADVRRVMLAQHPIKFGTEEAA